MSVKMIPALSGFDTNTAIGILARAALAVEDEDNPASEPILPNELAVRRAVMAEVRRILGTEADDQRPETIETLGDILDRERDSLIEPTNTESTLIRLSEKGELPSDLFDIRIIPNIEQFYGRKFAQEKRLIEQTMRAPDQEQQYGPPSDPSEPFLISLFAKYFPDPYPLRSFTLLVVGRREGLILDVHQVWRLYPDSMDLTGASDLVDMLRRFSDKFGTEIELGGKRGHFILTAELPKDQPIRASWKLQAPAENRKKREGRVRKRTITVTCFTQNNPLGASNQAALATAIDLDRYRDTIEAHGW